MKLLRRTEPSRREMRQWDKAYAAMNHWITWSQAGDLKQLGELTAQWLEGDIPYCPGYCADGPDPETKPLIGYLTAYNRAGFVTHNSQPGTAPENGAAQRAWVEGWCTQETAEKIENAALGTDLIVGCTPPGAANSRWLLVSLV